jgi:hypothetical protein
VGMLTSVIAFIAMLTAFVVVVALTLRHLSKQGTQSGARLIVKGKLWKAEASFELQQGISPTDGPTIVDSTPTGPPAIESGQDGST